MLGTSTVLVTTGDGGTSANHGGGGGGGEAVQSSIMTGMIGDDQKTRSGGSSGGGGGGGGGGGDLFEGDRSTGGNRWPRQETLALLKIRSDMDVTFRDSSLKGPLWEEVSRKMGELGYHRSAKKCKEKFENVYKYHKRTKDGRVGKAEGKTYRFFDQLQALEQHHHHLSMSNSTSSTPSLPPLPQITQSQAPALDAVPVTMVIPAGTGSVPAGVTVTSSSHPISVIQTSPNKAPIIHHQRQQPQQQQQQQHQQMSVNPTNNNHPNVQIQQSPMHQATGTMPGGIQMENPDQNPAGSGSPSATQSSSSMTSSDEEVVGMRRKRKRKWKDYFEKLMKEVIEKQEELQKRFLEAVEKRENDRVAREDAWKLQEMERLNREHDILVQERSIAAAKDAALIAFLQKLSDQQNIPLPLPPQAQAQTQAQPQAQTQAQTLPQVQKQVPQPQPQPQINMVENPGPPPKQPRLQPPPQPQLQPQPQPQPVTSLLTAAANVTPSHLQQAMLVANTNNNGENNVMDLQKENNNEINNNNNLQQQSSSRWPKAEIQTLINLRTSLDQKYQENGPKGPLWEEISSLMKKNGYNRNAKRCKEKWENINKYYKKVKEQNKKRPEDSKTCPYFHQLDVLYREKNKMEITTNNPVMNQGSVSIYGQQNEIKNEGNLSTSMAEINVQQWPQMNRNSEQTIMEDQGSENLDESDHDDDDDDDDDQGRGYEIVANNNGVNAQ